MNGNLTLKVALSDDVFAFVFWICVLLVCDFVCVGAWLFSVFCLVHSGVFLFCVF